jgi:hypothetical protein
MAELAALECPPEAFMALTVVQKPDGGRLRPTEKVTFESVPPEAVRRSMTAGQRERGPRDTGNALRCGPPPLSQRCIPVRTDKA